jgi:hypothetical protein
MTRFTRPQSLDKGDCGRWRFYFLKRPNAAKAAWPKSIGPKSAQRFSDKSDAETKSWSGASDSY